MARLSPLKKALADLRRAETTISLLQAESESRVRECQRMREQSYAVEQASHERVREYQAALGRARDLLIHEKVAAQKEGRAAGYIQLPSGGTAPVGWRLNGVTDLISTIDQMLKG